MLSPSFFFGFQWMAARSTSSFSWQLSRETEGTQTRGHSCIGWDLTVEVFRWATCASLHFYSCLISLTSYRVSDSIKYSRIELLLCGTVSLLDLRNLWPKKSRAKPRMENVAGGKSTAHDMIWIEGGEHATPFCCWRSSHPFLMWILLMSNAWKAKNGYLNLIFFYV